MSEMDAISAAILRKLSRDGRRTNVELAERGGLSASACLRRVQDLERRGVIRGYRAVLDRTLLDRTLLDRGLCCLFRRRPFSPYQDSAGSL